MGLIKIRVNKDGDRIESLKKKLLKQRQHTRIQSGKSQWQWEEGNKNTCSGVLQCLAGPVKAIPSQLNPT